MMIMWHWKNVFLPLFLIIYVCFTFGNEKGNDTIKELYDISSDDINHKLEMLEFCQSTNLKILPLADTPMNTITITFTLSDEMFKDCFTYYDIFLEKKRQIVNAAKIMYIYNLEKKASYTFYNVSCGVYEIAIQPCFNDWQCAPLKIRYPKLINMSSIDCFNIIPVSVNDTLVPTEGIKTDIIIVAAIISVLFTFIFASVYYYYWKFFKHRQGNKKERILEKDIEENKSDEEKVLIKRIHVLIFHYYDKKGKVKEKANIFKDFLEKSSFYSSVKLIETELAEILQNPNDWLNKTLEEEREDGSSVKIIIIDSIEDDEVEEYEIENYVYTQAIDMLGNDKRRSLADYDNLFVVKFDSTQAHSRRISNFVRGHRYSLSNFHHLINLCINLCSGSGLDLDKVEEKFKKMYFEHEVRKLGLIQHV